LFCKAAIEATRALPFGPGEDCVFVANDWHSALVPVLLKVSMACVLQDLVEFWEKTCRLGAHATVLMLMPQLAMSTV
jgi:hypothetical protein